MKILSMLAQLCAVLAGILLTGITLVTCGNLIMRNTTGDAMAGAFELTAMASGAAIALFMPLCQVRQGNIIVDFFTANLSDKATGLLDRFGALVLALVYALIAWRTYLGCMNVYESHSETQILGFPEWVVYATMLPAFGLTGLIGLYQAVMGFENPTENKQ
jgi:TRAP-type C4-dicarboxylate transport system permease small subunit